MAITASDFNNIRNKVVAVLGTGATGYGITPVSTAATASTAISTTLWNNLRTDMLKARQHQTGRDETVYAPATLTKTTKITNTIKNNFDAYANTIVGDQRSLGLTPVAQAQTEAFFDSSYSANWNSTLYYRAKIKFANNLTARYFFNSGGEIRFYAVKTGTPTLSKDVEWTTIIGSSATKNGAAGSGFGKIVYGYNTIGQLAGSFFGSAGTSDATKSFYAAPSYDNSNLPISTSPAVVFSKSASAYASNIYDIRMYADNATSPTELTFLIRFQDLATGILDEQNTGTITQYVEILRPVVAGGVTVTGPSLALSSQGALGLTNYT